MAPGVVEHIEGDRFTLGEPVGQRTRARAALARGADRAPGSRRRCGRDIRDEIWVKLWGNSAFNPISALTGATLDVIAADPGTRALSPGMMLEAQAIGEKLGVRFPIDVDRRIDGAGEVGAHKTSMLQDLERAGRSRSTRWSTRCSSSAGLAELTPSIDTVLALVRPTRPDCRSASETRSDRRTTCGVGCRLGHDGEPVQRRSGRAKRRARRQERAMKDNRRTGGQILVDQLRIHGVDRLRRARRELPRGARRALRPARSIRYVICRQEGGAAMMAEAYGKLTGRPGICFVTRGPGATNASVGVHIARAGFDADDPVHRPGRARRCATARRSRRSTTAACSARWPSGWRRSTTPTRIPELVSRAFTSRRSAGRARSCWRCPRTC